MFLTMTHQNHTAMRIRRAFGRIVRRPMPDPMPNPMPNRPIIPRQRYMPMMEIPLLDHSLPCPRPMIAYTLMPTPTCPVSTLMPTTTTPVPSSVPNLLAPIPPFPNA